ncbi:MAG TPA: hypothetical protein VFP89_07775 [Propionibacteriaceae bacterium]|nr:hypothetical protein [Propionibacteriaceae bacterium]
MIAGLALLVMLAEAPFYFAAGLLAPGWAVVIFIAVWLTLFTLGCIWFRRRPLWVLAVPLLAAAFWFGGLSAGEALLGWTA